MKEKSSLPRQAFTLYFLSFIGVVVSSIVNSLVGQFLPNSTGVFLVMTSSLILLVVLVYSAASGFGEKDATYDVYRPEEARGAIRGFFIGLLAALPYFLSSLLLVLAKLEMIPDYTAFYKVFNMSFYWLINRFIPYATVEGVSWGGILMVSLFPLTIPIVSYLGYRFSYNQNFEEMRESIEKGNRRKVREPGKS